MKLWCWYCHKDVTSELPAGTVFRAIAVCPECLPDSEEASGYTSTGLLVDPEGTVTKVNGDGSISCLYPRNDPDRAGYIPREEVIE